MIYYINIIIYLPHEQIKSRYQQTGTKEIKKVAEARMRKRKRAALQLKAAKKQANVMAESNEVSEKQKLKVSTFHHCDVLY